MLTNIFYLNEQGKRKNIEDHIFPLPGKATVNDKLFLVCDGVGGLSKGEEASRIACESISEYLLRKSKEEISEVVIKKAVGYALLEMETYANEHPAAEQMSTTLTLAYLQNNNGVWVAWCGDSRIYHIRDGKVLWRSKDHSLVQQLIDNGEITAEEAIHHPQKNIILRSLSATQRDSKIDTYLLENILAGDYLLLCTDGILENIDDIAIRDILGTQQKETDKKKLFLKYCDNKTSDNFSMYLLEFSGSNKLIHNKNNYVTFVLLGLMVLIAFSYLCYIYLLPKLSLPIYNSKKDTISHPTHTLVSEDSMIKLLNKKMTREIDRKRK